jgi:hypothetical protein
MSKLNFKKLTYSVTIDESDNPVDVCFLNSRQIAFIVQLIGERNVQTITQIMQQAITNEQSIALRSLERSQERARTKLAYLNNLRPTTGDGTPENLQKQIDETVAELDDLEHKQDAIEIAVLKQRNDLLQTEIFRIASELPDKILIVIAMLLGLSKYDPQKEAYIVEPSDLAELDILSAVSALDLLYGSFTQQYEGFAAAMGAGKKSSSVSTAS